MGENIWAKIGAIAGVIAVGITVWFFFETRSDQSKGLEIELIAQSTLIDENVSREKRRIVIYYDGRKISNYVILQLRVVNTGRQPIRNSDYEEPLQLHLNNVSEVLSAEQVTSSSKQLEIKPEVLCSPDCQSVKIPNTLLNPKDWYTLEVGGAAESGEKIEIEHKGRIAGVKQIVFKNTLSPPLIENNPDYFFIAILILLASRWREIKYQQIGALRLVATIKKVGSKRLSWKF